MILTVTDEIETKAMAKGMKKGIEEVFQNSFLYAACSFKPERKSCGFFLKTCNVFP